MLPATTAAVGVVLLVALVWAGIASWREAEPRAAGLLGLLAVTVPAPYGVVGLVAFGGRIPAAAALPDRMKADSVSEA